MDRARKGKRWSISDWGHRAISAHTTGILGIFFFVLDGFGWATHHISAWKVKHWGILGPSNLGELGPVCQLHSLVGRLRASARADTESNKHKLQRYVYGVLCPRSTSSAKNGKWNGSFFSGDTASTSSVASFLSKFALDVSSFAIHLLSFSSVHSYPYILIEYSSMIN